MKVALSALSLLLVAACAQTPSLPPGKVFGENLEARETVRYSALAASPASYFNQTLLVEANVLAVCQKAGCWMQIEDAGDTAVVQWEAGCAGQYKFPKELAGGKVLIQGSFYPKKLDDDAIEHLQGEAGRPIKLEKEGFELNASSVLVLD